MHVMAVEGRERRQWSGMVVDKRKRETTDRFRLEKMREERRVGYGRTKVRNGLGWRKDAFGKSKFKT